MNDLMQQLETEGHTALKGWLGHDLIDGFEREVDELGRRQLEAHGVAPANDVEPMIQLFRLGGKYRHVLYNMMQNLSSLTAIKMRVLEAHSAGGPLAPLGFDLPISGAALRVDLPYEDKFCEPVHQDYSVSAPPGYHAWVPLRRVDEHHGSVRIWPGTHKLGFVHHNTDDPKRAYIEPANYEGRPSMVVELDPGDVLVFNAFCFHASVPNRSDRIKFIGGFMMQDIARIHDPDRPDENVWDMVSMTSSRQAANKLKAS